ncbi:antiviral RADAR system adenosine deaminase RdrB [Chromobacterium subtsugae]|uniref:antiviral RADAR system adenosine deaminase RdrB n=1 Tax=Chromobacterium subtsugae TaxID=251747 RepID=UPI0006414A62|nr:antiviral RADAR system adenosine deaminase RdrB [Chromobacterium subtsugae]
MLQRTLTEHAAVCFFGDERLAAWLWQHLLQPAVALESDRWHLLQEHFYHLLVEGVEARYPRKHRLTDVRQLMGRILDGGLLLTSVLPWLDELQQRLLQRNGDLLCYREGEVQAYVRLAAGVDPTLLAAWHLAKWLDDMPQPLEHDIRRVVSAQTAFFAPSGNPSLPFAEGHVHFWGVTADSAILDDYLLADGELTLSGKANSWQREQHDKLQLLLSRARQLLVLLLEPATPQHQTPDGQNKQPGDQKDTQQPNTEGWPQHLKRLTYALSRPIRQPDWGLLAARLSAANPGSADWLLGEFGQAMSRGEANRWLWLFVYLCRRYGEQKTHPLQRAAILCFWQTVNQLRGTLIMDGQGLTRFAERYYQAALGRGGDYQGNVRRLWAGRADVAEIKSGPLAFKPALVSEIARGLIANASLSLPKPPYIFGEPDIQLDMKALSSMQALERWQFCGHFSRSQPHKQNQYPKPDGKKIWQEAEKLIRNLQSTSGWSAPEFLGGKLNPNFHFQPARWFRGLDVAGDENALKIEWFAPVLRWLRSGFKSRQDGERASMGFHLSIHSGEDYAHPASGMRHIDETVRFCEMREGDRLGHALALGIEPKQWAARQGEMMLPLDEHLDNLVWLWHHASVLSGVLPLAQQVLPRFERRIARFWRLSRWWQVPDLMADDGVSRDEKEASVSQAAGFEASPLRHATADDLYQAWYLRRNCHFRLQSLSGAWPVDSKELYALPDHGELSENRTLASQLYKARHDWRRADEMACDKANAQVQLDRKERKHLERLVIVRMGDEAAVHGGFHLKVGRKRDEGLLEDVDTPAELDFMHALQDWLLTEYDKLGLILEANPTSNVYIARLKSHAEHPIFRWNPPDESALAHGAAANLYGLRRGPVRVLVNTDDPGIMPTTLRTEFLLLREAALERKVGRTVAERWLETLRQYGIEQFHRNHLPVFEPA